MNELKTKEPIDLMDGEYQATWSGWKITVHTLDNDVEADTISKVRGTIELNAVIEDGIIYNDKI